VLLRDLADLAGDQVDAFGDANRRVHRSCRSYLGAMAKWIGLMMTTEAFGTAAQLPELAFDGLIAVSWQNFSFNSRIETLC